MNISESQSEIQSDEKKICPIFGRSKDMPNDVLPTYSDIIKFYVWCESSFPFELIAFKISQNWNNATIPTVSKSTIVRNLRNFYKQYRNTLKSNGTEHCAKNFSDKLLKFKEKYDKIFDISACKCCYEKCKCVSSKSIPIHMRTFLEDQRNKRALKIPKNIVKQKTNLSKNSRDCQPTNHQENHYSESDSSCNESDCDYKPPEKIPKINHQVQNRINIEPIVEQAARYGVSVRAAAAISSATLTAIGLVDNKNTNLVIDKNKVQRQAEKSRQQLCHPNVNGLIGLFFDGRKDQTLSIVKSNGRSRKVSKVEEHISLVCEPESSYIGHISPIDGKAMTIKKSISEYLTNEKIKINDLCAIGVDGTAVNTGPKGGIVHLLEIHFGRSMQWLVCLLHANELPFRHLFIEVDGKTCGPTGFTGPIGKLLPISLTFKICKFVPIQTDLPNITSDLSNDQKYLYDICKATSNGIISPQLADRKPGNISHSRWLTTANNVMRLYVSTEEPTDQLILLANYISTVYAPTWFYIKKNSKCKDGAKNIWYMINKSKYLDKKYRGIVNTVIQRNGFYCHHENILLSMLCDERYTVRKLAVQRILKFRNNSISTLPSPIRPFIIPKINFFAKDYFNMIHWENCIKSEPPLTRAISNEILQQIADGTIDGNTMEIFNLPCHSQAVERCVKSVTEASLRVVGHERRDGLIRMTLKSRQKMPSFNTKSEYSV